MMVESNVEVTADGVLPTEENGQPPFPDFAPEDENYPWEALPQTVRGAVIEICRNEGVAVPIAAQAVLSAISLACQDLIFIDRGIAAGQKSVCSLFLITVSDTGSRKSRADELVVKPIEEYDLAQRASYENAVTAYELAQSVLLRKIRELEKSAGSLLRKSITLPVSGKIQADELALKAEKLATMVEQQLAELQGQVRECRKPRWQKILYEKISVRSLEQSLAQNWPAAALISDEAAGILKSKGESDMASLDCLWDGASLDVVGRTKQESFFVHDPRLTLSLMVQPIVFDRFLERKGELAKGIGLMSRVLLSRPDTPYGKRTFKHQNERSTVWIERFNRRVKELLVHSHSAVEERNGKRKTLYFEPDAQKLWVEMYNAVEENMAAKGKFEHDREFANRIAEHVARLSALFHFFEHGNLENQTGSDLAIPKTTVEAAIQIADWYFGEFRRVFNQESRMREMGQYVLSKLKDLLERENGFSLDDPPNVHIVRSIAVQTLRANCSKYGLKKIENFRPLLEWLHNRGNVSIREASRPSNKIPNPPRRIPESVEIKCLLSGNKYEFFFDVDHQYRTPRSS